MIKFHWEKEFQETEIGEIPKDWGIEKLGRICKVTSSKRVYFKEYVSFGIPFYRGKEIILLSKGEKVINPLYISFEKYKELKDKYGVPSTGDLLLSAIGTIGYIYRVKESDRFYFKDGNILWIKSFGKSTNSLYLKFVIPLMLKIQELTIGSSQEALTIERLNDLNIPFPLPSEQSRIATVLSWFDDLIENKKRQNEILEKTAMAIFKNWFVDFEPFKNEEFVYNEELGKRIPNGWETGFLKNMCNDIISGRGRYVIESQEGDFPLYGANGIIGYINTYDLDQPALLTGRVGTLGKVFYVCGKFAISDNVLAILPRKREDIYFLYFWLKKFVDFESLNVGSTQPLITKTALNSELILIPPDSVLYHFHKFVDPLFKKIITNQKQIMVLKKMRDTLLPKLIFGKLRVMEAPDG